MPADPLAEAHALLTAWLDGDDSCATLQRARAWVDARRAADVPPPVERRNCWTCIHAFKEARRCRQLTVEAVEQWVNATHGDTRDGTCPPDADGCPGWQPTDPPPSAEVPRG